MSVDYTTHNDVSIYAVKRDILGRKRHPKQENNRIKQYHSTYGLRMEKEMMDRIVKQAKKMGVSKAELIRTHIEWGLENG